MLQEIQQNNMSKRDPAHTIIIQCNYCGERFPVDIDPDPQIEDMKAHLAVCKGKKK